MNNDEKIVSFISYPKSGRTWMRYIVKLMIGDANPPPVYMKFSHAGYGTGYRKEIGRRFDGVESQYLRDRNIFMYRNALDTAVSMFFQVHKTDFRKWDKKYIRKYLMLKMFRSLPPKDINKFVLDPVWGVENICLYNRSWLTKFDALENSHIINYEETKKDTENVIINLANYLGIQPLMSAHEIVEKSRFDRMKKIELSSPDSSKTMLHGMRKGDEESMKVRRGIVKGYADYLDDRTISTAQEIAIKSGFDI